MLPFQHFVLKTIAIIIIIIIIIMMMMIIIIKVLNSDTPNNTYVKHNKAFE